MALRLASFRDLGPLYWDLHDFVPTLHFLHRCRERGFDRRWLPHLWTNGTWLPAEQGRLAIVGEIPGYGWWRVIVAPDGWDGVPVLVTVAWLGASRHVA